MLNVLKKKSYWNDAAFNPAAALQGRAGLGVEDVMILVYGNCPVNNLFSLW